MSRGELRRHRLRLRDHQIQCRRARAMGCPLQRAGESKRRSLCDGYRRFRQCLCYGRKHRVGTDADYATIRYNSSGQKQWVARYNGPANGSDYGQAIAFDNREIYVTGWSRGAGTNLDYATIKYNSGGQQQWAARYHGPGTGLDQPYAIAVDSSGTVYSDGENQRIGNVCRLHDHQI